MFVLLLITVALLQSAPQANGFLDDCPFDRDQKIDNTSVIGVLKNFYNDLVFVEAITESRQDRNYSNLLAELALIVSPGARHRQIEQMAQMLIMGHFEEAARRSNTIFWDQRDLLSVRSYLHYFKAEALRLRGFPADASSQVLDAIQVRQRSTGVSLNDLEKLDGLITLHRVSQFNKEVDYSYCLRPSPNFELLMKIHSILKDELSPLNTIRSAVLSRLPAIPVSCADNSLTAHSSERESTSADGTRTMNQLPREDPDQDDFRGQSLPKKSAEGILCEFALKLSILGSSSPDGTEDKPLEYSNLVIQLTNLDAAFAKVFYENVVRLVENNQEATAMRNVVSFWSMLHSSGPRNQSDPFTYPHLSQYEHGKMLETYAKYFRAEIYRRLRDHCKYLKQIEMLLDRIKNDRRERKGVSLDKILELEGKIVVMSLNCFHERIRSAYRLLGDEDEQQLDAKRDEFGSGDMYFPESGMPYCNVPVYR